MSLHTTPHSRARHCTQPHAHPPRPRRVASRRVRDTTGRGAGRPAEETQGWRETGRSRAIIHSESAGLSSEFLNPPGGLLPESLRPQISGLPLLTAHSACSTRCAQPRSLGSLRSLRSLRSLTAATSPPGPSSRSSATCTTGSTCRPTSSSRTSRSNMYKYITSQEARFVVASSLGWVYLQWPLHPGLVVIQERHYALYGLRHGLRHARPSRLQGRLRAPPAPLSRTAHPLRPHPRPASSPPAPR